ncbi:MAG TPA: nicotinamide riboside transporter PnuC [Hyphomonadaceae bacterium]|nr:nicotinamide riboside transporter PnuC [Hyphomonadaceae bacterium]
MDVNPLELAATLVTLACVILGVKRSLWQFPVGIVGTALFFITVLQAKIWANAALQVFFVFVQIYGWWYWLRGAGGKRPPIRSANPVHVIVSVAAGLALAWAASWGLTTYTDFDLAFVDATTFSVSVVAQYLLDRKYLETWPVWLIVNVASIYLYSQAHMWLFTGLYVFFFFNAFWGWWEWRQAMKKEAAPPATAAA